MATARGTRTKSSAPPPGREASPPLLRKAPSALRAEAAAAAAASKSGPAGPPAALGSGVPAAKPKQAPARAGGGALRVAAAVNGTAAVDVEGNGDEVSRTPSPEGRTSEDYVRLITEIYKTHNSDKAKAVTYLLEKYKGREEVLYRSVKSKYVDGKEKDGKRTTPATADTPTPTDKNGLEVNEKPHENGTALKSGGPAKAVSAAPARPKPKAASDRQQAPAKQASMAELVKAVPEKPLPRQSFADGMAVSNDGLGCDDKLLADIDAQLLGTTTDFFTSGVSTSQRPAHRNAAAKSETGTKTSAPGEADDAPKLKKARVHVNGGPTTAAATAPTLFDQWLAVLNYIKDKQADDLLQESEVQKRLMEHLQMEGIRHRKTCKGLCNTVVPLLMDLSRIDASISKHLPARSMRQCEIKELHTGVLRIVAFEFLREHNRRHACRAKRKAEQDGDVRMDIELASAPMALTLSGDMLTLANLVKHFDFDLHFVRGLQRLIASILGRRLRGR